jgi:hypothetical protein
VRFPLAAFKIATQLIEQRLEQQLDSTSQPQMTEPADLPLTEEPLQGSVLSLLGHNDRSTAKEQAPKVITDSGRQAWS